MGGRSTATTETGHPVGPEMTATTSQGPGGPTAIAALTSDERSRLVRLCGRVSGDPAAAEDLAQETLLEAWRHANRLVDPVGRDAWLAAIARNVCRRHARLRARADARLVPAPSADGEAASDLDLLPHPAAGEDLELVLGRDDLATLLDRALALLPPATRDALVGHYVNELPQAEIATRLGVSEGAVAVRIHRGKLAFRRALASPALAADAVAHGLGAAPGAAPDGWRETRIWCPLCGDRRLHARFSPSGDRFTLTCPRCPPRMPGDRVGNMVNSFGAAERLAGVRSPRPALNRVMANGDAYYRGAIATGGAPCFACGHPAPVTATLPPELPERFLTQRGIHLRCPRCGSLTDLRLPELSLWTPEGRAFWRAHPRIRMLPERAVEAAGRPAVVTEFVSVSGTARLAAVADQETYRLLAVHGVPPSDDAPGR